MLPKILYIYKDTSTNGEDNWFVANENLECCANQKSPTLVGTYKLEETQIVILVVKSELQIKTV